MTPRQKMTRYSVLAVLLLAGLSWIVYASTGSRPEQPSATPASGFMQVRAEQVDAVESVTRDRSFTGVLRATRDSQLSFERAGRITDLLADEGVAVKKGQLLGRLDVEQVATGLVAARAAVAQAEAVLAELVAGPRTEAIATARANVASLQADASRLERDFSRSERLFSTSAISRERFDAARFQRDAIIAQKDAAQRQLDELLAGTRKEKLAAQRALLERLQAEQRTLELDLEDGNLVAPFDGTIAERFLDEGTVVAPGTPVYRIVEAGPLEAWIGIPPRQAASLEVGQAYPGVLDAAAVTLTLRSVRPSLDPITRTQNVVFDLSLKAESSVSSIPTAMVSGQIVRLSLSQQVEARGVVVPTTALVPGPRGLWTVFVIVPDDFQAADSQRPVYRVQQRDVTLIESLGLQSLVSGTLESGMFVILDGVHRVVAGQQVERLADTGVIP